MDAICRKRLLRIQTDIEKYTEWNENLETQIQTQKDILALQKKNNVFLMHILDPVQLKEYNKIHNLSRK